MKDLAEAWLPLAGIRVVDFSMFVPGPFASAILADLGFDDAEIAGFVKEGTVKVA